MHRPQPGDATAGPDPEPAEDLSWAALALARRFAAGPPCGASRRRGPPTPATSPSSSCTRSSSASAPCRPSASTPPAPPRRCASLARPGDVLLVVSTAADPVACDLIARADAWGLTSLWIGAGPRPGPGNGLALADHVVWLDDDTGAGGGALGRPRPPLPPALGADPRRLRAPRAAGARARPPRRRLRDLLGRGPRAPRSARSSRRGASRCSPAGTPSRSTAASWTTFDPATWSWCTPASP